MAALFKSVLALGIASVLTGPALAQDSMDGFWIGTYTPTTRTDKNGATCAHGAGKLFVALGNLTGTASNPVGGVFEVEGDVTAQNRLKGRFLANNRPAGTFDGRIAGEHLQGTYATSTGCKGTWVGVRKR